MTVFHVEITDHSGHFGETPMTEQRTIAGLLHDIAQRVGSHVLTATEAHPEPIILNREQVGQFWFGPNARSATAPRR